MDGWEDAANIVANDRGAIVYLLFQLACPFHKLVLNGVVAWACITLVELRFHFKSSSAARHVLGIRLDELYIDEPFTAATSIGNDMLECACVTIKPDLIRWSSAAGWAQVWYARLQTGPVVRWVGIPI